MCAFLVLNQLGACPNLVHREPNLSVFSLFIKYMFTCHCSLYGTNVWRHLNNFYTNFLLFRYLKEYEAYGRYIWYWVGRQPQYTYSGVPYVTISYRRFSLRGVFNLFRTKIFLFSSIFKNSHNQFNFKTFLNYL